MLALVASSSLLTLPRWPRSFPVLLEPLLLELRRPPGELKLLDLELIQLVLGFRDTTPELLYVTFQAVTLVDQLTEPDGQPVDSPGRYLRRSGCRCVRGDALTIAAKPGHCPTLAPWRLIDRMPRRQTQPA